MSGPETSPIVGLDLLFIPQNITASKRGTPLISADENMY
jgi:hypothetical protein